MKPSDSQQILSRLYTDQAYRQAFLSGKETFYQTYEIADPEAIAFLDALKPEQLEFFAKGLYAKKYHEVMYQIPGTAFLLKDRIGGLFRTFSQTPGNYGVHRHHEEALALIDFIRDEKTISHEAKAILKFEEMLIRNFTTPKACRICLLRYDVLTLMKSLQAGEKPVLQKKRLLIIFRKGKVFKIF